VWCTYQLRSSVAARRVALDAAIFDIRAHKRRRTKPKYTAARATSITAPTIRIEIVTSFMALSRSVVVRTATKQKPRPLQHGRGFCNANPPIASYGGGRLNQRRLAIFGSEPVVQRLERFLCRIRARSRREGPDRPLMSLCLRATVQFSVVSEPRQPILLLFTQDSHRRLFHRSVL
jgi:hypothetical protein